MKVSPSASFAILAAIVLLLIGGWSLFWFFAAHQTEALIDSWIEREASVDRRWTCPDREISGYPFRIEISCANAGFAGEALGKQLIGGLKGFHATASLFDPDSLDALTSSPFTLHGTAGEGDMVLQWDVLRIRLKGEPQQLPSLSIDGSNVSVSGAFKDFGTLSGRAGSVRSNLVGLPERRSEEAYSFHIGLADATIPTIDAILGGDGTDAVTFDGVVTKADLTEPGTLAQRLEHWRASGGQVEFKDARLIRGATLVAGRGVLRLDDGHRPAGTLDTDFAGLDPVLKRYGINPGIVGAGALLSSLFGGHPKTAAPPADARPALHLPVALSDGFVSVGPVKTPVAVPALY